MPAAAAVELAQALTVLELVALAVLLDQGLAFYEYLRADQARVVVGQYLR